MASTLRDFLAEIDKPQLQVPAAYQAFIDGERVSPKTREVLNARRKPPASIHNLFTNEQVSTLRAMLDRVIPQSEPALDLTGYIMERLATGRGDGWRYDVLPPDVEAYREGLDRLAWQGFGKMNVEAQDQVLRQLSSQPSSAAARWFEEVRGDAVSAYMAHPATMARIGYSGIGVGGAHTPFQGYITLGPNEREDWEPLASGI
jgi:hypothetical protein